MLWLAVLTLSLPLYGIAEEEGGKYYVIPSNASESNIPSCHPLSYYAENLSKYFVTDSTLIFLPGEHTLSHGTNITVQSISRVSLRAHNTTAPACGSRWNNRRPVIDCHGGEAGLAFIDVAGLEIHGIDITNCGQTVNSSDFTTSTYPQTLSATLSLRNVTNFTLINTHIMNSWGYGIRGQNIIGESSIEECVFKNSNRYKQHNQKVHGGNIGIYYNTSCHNIVSTFKITKTNITDGYSTYYASGLDLVLSCMDGGIHFTLDQVTMSRNGGSGFNESGVNFGFYLLASPNLTNRIRMNRCTIERGNSHGMTVSIYINGTNTTDNTTVLRVDNTKFVNNTSQSPGSGLQMKLCYTNEIIHTQVGIVFQNCHFEQNILATYALEQRGGVAVHIVVFKVIESELHSTPQFKTSFTNCTFSKNNLWYHQSLSSGVIYVEEHANVIIENCTIRDNNSTGITAVHSYIRFTGSNTIERNSAINGGGILLHSRAVMLLSENSTLWVRNNSAKETGGGIHAEFGMHSAIPPCFFQFDAHTLLNESRRSTVQVHLCNNTAKSTGTAVYGGEIDNCYFLVDNTPSRNKYLLSQSSGKIFNKTFNYKQTPQAISSDPIKVCLCNNSHINCSTSFEVVNKSPGETFSINVTVVGQRNGLVSGIVNADFLSKNSCVKIEPNEHSQQVKHCTQLSYTVYSQKENIQANLSLYVSESPCSTQFPLIVINVIQCPKGFTLINQEGGGKCECISLLTQRDIKCNSKDLTIHRPSRLWIGYKKSTSTSDILVKRCPLTYCKPFETNITAFKDYIDQDSQCNFRRKDLFCGRCKPELSMVFGTPRCCDCKEYGGWAAIGVLFAFALVGIILVAFLFACNFTVTEGTINGFIFYANVVQIYQDIYFPLTSHSSLENQLYLLLRTLISWLNLDIGMEVCFFNGMTTFHKTWLQFVFPVYIWLIAGLLIWLSRRSTHITRLMKNNGTKVLATLILLSYAKLMRAIMASYAAMHTGPNSNVWYYDGSLGYFEGVHIILFLNATLYSVILLPFTLALLFIKHLPRLTSLAVFRWLNNLKPLFDAYTGPYTDEYRFWAGLQLLVRLYLLCFSATNNNVLILLQVAGICTLLLSANYFYGTRIYKKRSVNIIEALLLINLMLWSMTSVYCNDNNQCTHDMVFPFAGLTLLGLGVVLVRYHLFKTTYYTRAYEKIRLFFKRIVSFVSRKKRGNVVGEGRGSEHNHLLPVDTLPVVTYSELSIPTDASNND